MSGIPACRGFLFLWAAMIRSFSMLPKRPRGIILLIFVCLMGIIVLVGKMPDLGAQVSSLRPLLLESGAGCRLGLPFP